MSWANWPTWTSRCGRARSTWTRFDPTGQSAELADSDRRVRGNLAVMRDWAARPAGGRQGAGSRCGSGSRPVRRSRAPNELSGPVLPERTRLDEQGRFTGTGEYETIPAQMVFRSVGYQSVPLDGVPFDERTDTVPNDEGRVLGPDGAPLPGEYVAGWLKRGPTGVVGTNKSDAAATVRSLLADLAGRPWSGRGRPAVRYGGLAARGVRPVSYVDWLRVETAEAELAAALDRGERVKIGGRGRHRCAVPAARGLLA